jgi:hypothetical protein
MKIPKCTSAEILRGMVVGSRGTKVHVLPAHLSRKIGWLPQGSGITVLQIINKWYRIDNGFVYSKYIKLL